MSPGLCTLQVRTECLDWLLILNRTHLERVLRVIAELYDVHGGKRKAEDLHFRGLPKVKVMIHEYEPAA